MPGTETLFRRLFTCALLLFAVSFTCFRIQSSDVFMYLALARDYLAKGDWNFNDIYLYSLPNAHLVWVHEYLSYWLFYAAWGLGGTVGLVLLKMLLLAAIFTLVLRAQPLDMNRSLLWTALWSLAVVAASFRFVERSSLISDLAMVFTAGLLLNRHQVDRHLLWRLTFLFVLWIQFHPGFPTALVLLFLWVVWNGIFNPQFEARDTLWLLIPVSALCLNPLGWRGVVYPFEFALNEAQVFKHYNYEWFPAYHPAFRFTPEVLAFWVLGAISLFVIWRERAWASLRCWFAIFAFFAGASAVRFIPWAAFTMVLAVKPWSSLRHIQPRHFVRFAVLAALVLVSVKNLTTGYNSSAGPRRPGFDLDAADFPSKTLAFLVEKPIAGRLYNSHEFGAYLIWLGRTPVFHHGFVTDMDFYQNEVVGVLSSAARFNELTAKYGWTMLLVDRNSTYPALYPILAAQPEWRIVAEDEASYLIYKIP